MKIDKSKLSLSVPQKKKKGPRHPTDVELRMWRNIVSLGCCVCGAPANLHHTMGKNGHVGKYKKYQRRDHRFVNPLCREHHQGNQGVHGMGSEDKFNKVYNLNLVENAIAQWEAVISRKPFQ